VLREYTHYDKDTVLDVGYVTFTANKNLRFQENQPRKLGPGLILATRKLGLGLGMIFATRNTQHTTVNQRQPQT
jgi:hypothetical protein